MCRTLLLLLLLLLSGCKHTAGRLPLRCAGNTACCHISRTAAISKSQIRQHLRLQVARHNCRHLLLLLLALWLLRWGASFLACL
jgi:hypothetical protein